MLIFDASFILSLMVFAHVTESKIYFLRDFEDDPIQIDETDRVLQNYEYPSKHKPASSGSHKPKRMKHSKQAVMHYGRHIYHLDSFEDLSKLRSMTSPEYISYDYFDINDLIRSRDPQQSIPWEYVKDIVYLTARPNDKKCKGQKCNNNLRKYNALLRKRRRKISQASVESYVKRKKIPFGTLTRFKIVDNTKSKSKATRGPSQPPRDESSEEKIHVKKKPIPIKKKKKIVSSESSSEEKDNSWGESNSESREKWNKSKKKIIESSSQSSEEAYTTKKPKKKYVSESNSDSWENLSKNVESNSNSIEKSLQKKKKKKKKQKRKTDGEDEIYLQGNKLITVSDSEEDNNEDQRRRLPQFLPKRYHWDPSDIHDLGYYWFNGPKGKYPEPKPL